VIVPRRRFLGILIYLEVSLRVRIPPRLASIRYAYKFKSIESEGSKRKFLKEGI